jgi:hypothetical protein
VAEPRQRALDALTLGGQKLGRALGVHGATLSKTAPWSVTSQAGRLLSAARPLPAP